MQQPPHSPQTLSMEDRLPTRTVISPHLCSCRSLCVEPHSPSCKIQLILQGPVQMSQPL